MSPSGQENDHSASCMLCPMGLSRGGACFGQGTEAKVAGLEQVSGGVKGVLHLETSSVPRGERHQARVQTVGNVNPFGGNNTQDRWEVNWRAPRQWGVCVCAWCGVCAHRDPLIWKQEQLKLGESR